MRNTSNWTGRCPRSLDEAFGPYNRQNVFEEVPWSKDEDRWVMVTCLAVVIVFGLLIYFGYIN